ncbi:MAG: hypothetical protein QW607_02525 [Desulfurococcaceae archaeon]
MNLTLKIRGKPESILSVLKKMDNNFNCYIYVNVDSESELMKIISLSLECGAFVEIMPTDTFPLHNNLELTTTKSNSETSLLNKYRKKSEIGISHHQNMQNNLQEETKEDNKTSIESTKHLSSSPVTTLQINISHPDTSVTRPIKHNHESRETFSEKEENIFDKVEESSQTDEIQFEEIVRMKDEAFSRKIIE